MKWQRKKLGDVIEFLNGKKADLSESGNYVVYGSNGIIGKSNNYRYENAIIIGRVGAYCGSIAYCPNKFWASDNTIVAKPKHNGDVRFFSYFLHNFGLNKYAGGAAQPLVTQTVLKSLEGDIPNPTLQRKIASILSAYDDLIENNTRRIAILEEMARRIYEEWFVRFRFPRHEQVKMVESELGLIPEGWKVKSVGEVLSYNIGGGWGNETQEGNFNVPAYVIRGTDIPFVRLGSLGNAPLRFHKESNFVSRKLEDGDIVFEVSGGSKDQPVGRSVIVNNSLLDSLKHPVICASFCKLVRVNKEIFAPELLQFHFDRIYNDRRIMKYQTQSTGITNFKFTYFLENEKLLVMPEQLQNDFLKIVKPMLNQVDNYGLKNENLRKTRDLLLPKLISGEVDVSHFPEPENV